MIRKYVLILQIESDTEEWGHRRAEEIARQAWLNNPDVQGSEVEERGDDGE